MEENKESIEQMVSEESKKSMEKTAPEENIEQIDTVESDEMPAESDNAPAKQEKEGVASWSEKSVTRKFMVIALTATVLLNAAVTSGITGALLKKQAAEISGLSGKGHARSEMRFDKNRKGQGKKTPSENNQNTEQNQEQASNVSIGIIIKEDSGVIVSQVTGDKAKNAGFKEGDKIVSVEGKSVTTGNDLISEVQSHKAGDIITVTVERDGQNVEIKTELE